MHSSNFNIVLNQAQIWSREMMQRNNKMAGNVDKALAVNKTLKCLPWLTSLTQIQFSRKDTLSLGKMLHFASSKALTSAFQARVCGVNVLQTEIKSFCGLLVIWIMYLLCFF